MNVDIKPNEDKKDTLTNIEKVINKSAKSDKIAYFNDFK